MGGCFPSAFIRWQRGLQIFSRGRKPSAFLRLSPCCHLPAKLQLCDKTLPCAPPLLPTETFPIYFWREAELPPSPKQSHLASCRRRSINPPPSAPFPARHPPYSQHFPRALGSPAALVVLGLDVALGAVLQRAGDVALHHVGAVAPGGGKKHGKTVSPPAPGPASPAAPRQAGEGAAGGSRGRRCQRSGGWEPLRSLGWVVRGAEPGAEDEAAGRKAAGTDGGRGCSAGGRSRWPVGIGTAGTCSEAGTEGRGRRQMAEREEKRAEAAQLGDGGSAGWSRWVRASCRSREVLGEAGGPSSSPSAAAVAAVPGHSLAPPASPWCKEQPGAAQGNEL